MKQDGTYVVKILIAFIGVITESIMSQHPEIVRQDELKRKKGVYLTFDYRMFVGPHDLDIVISVGLYLLFPRAMVSYALVVDTMDVLCWMFYDCVLALCFLGLSPRYLSTYVLMV
jgi:hypothetical protein